MSLTDRLQISENKRFLVDTKGQPFFWLADTAWELFHRLTREDTCIYLDDRMNKGFTVIQAVILAELDGLNTPNVYGEVPLEANDPEKPREAYFSHVDWVLKEASARGIYMAILPTWGDKVNKRYDWAAGPEIFTTANAYHYGRFLGERYRDTHNIVWILGGDRDPDERGAAIWRAMAQGIMGCYNTSEQPLASFHPQPFDASSSAQFHRDDWLGFNMLQTGHERYRPSYETVAADYMRHPPKPVVDGEPLYEAHGIGFKPLEQGYSIDTDIRKYAYWSLFAGAFGHTYGCHSIWQFYTASRHGVNAPLYEWKAALNLAGAHQMTHVKTLMASRPMLNRIPDQHMLINPSHEPEEYVAATRAADGSYAFVYSTVGKPFEISTQALAGNRLRCAWFSPRDGSTTVEDMMDKRPRLAFRPPSQGYGNDWVLIIDSL